MFHCHSALGIYPIMVNRYFHNPPMHSPFISPFFCTRPLSIKQFHPDLPSPGQHCRAPSLPSQLGHSIRLGIMLIEKAHGQ